MFKLELMVLRTPKRGGESDGIRESARGALPVGSFTRVGDFPGYLRIVGTGAWSDAALV